MSLADLALGKARAQMAQRRIRLDDFFTDFDRLRTGRLTHEQFRRVLTLNHIALTEDEMNALVAAFQPVLSKGDLRSSVVRGPVEVSYADFLAALHGEEAPKEMVATVYRQPTVLSPAEESKLEPVVRMLRHAISARGINIVPPFKDLDPLNTGRVTNSQFQRCISFLHHMDESLLKLFEKKYGDGEGNVYYLMWCRDVDATLMEKEKMQGAVTATNTSPSSLFFSGSYCNADLTSDELIRILREQFALYRLRCEDFMTDFDKFKTGTISAAQFASALGRLKFVKFTLAEENVNALVRAYAVAEPDEDARACTAISAVPEAFVKVNYRNFLYDTNPKNFPVIGADNKPSDNYFLSTHAPDMFMTDEKELEAANRVLEKVSRLVRTNRIFLSPVLRDFDRVRKSIYEHRTCTSTRFARGLATQNLILPQEELQILKKKYTIPHADGSPSNEVNYYQFVQDVDPSQAQAPQAAATGVVCRGVVAQLQREAEQNRSRPSTDKDAVLAKIALQAEERQLRVGEFFLDFDPLRSSVLLNSQFVSALTIAGLQLEQSELDLLVKAYASTKVRGMVDVYNFLRDVGAYAPMSVPATILGLPDMSTDYARTTKQNPAASSTLTDAEESRLATVQKRLRHDVKSHSALLTPFFADFDRFNRGKITKNNFRQALARHRFPLTEEDAAALCKYYAAPGDAEYVDYRRFVSDIGDNESALPQVSNDSPIDGTAFGSEPAGATATVALQSECEYTDADLQEVLAKVCCYLQERRPRVSEFFPDGDELRHQHVTSTRFQHCVSILGIQLSARELDILEKAFVSTVVSPGEVDYPAFVHTVRGMLAAGAGIQAVTQRRLGETNALLASTTAKVGAASGSSSNGNLTREESLLVDTMAKIKRSLTSRRTLSLPAFREYDRTRKGHVKEGQFFACLMSLGVQLTPSESAVVCKAYTLGNGEMGYTRFAGEVDDTTFVTAS